MTDLEAAATWLNAQLPSVIVSVGPPTSGTRGDQPDRLGDLAGAVGQVAVLLTELHGLPTDGLRQAVPGVGLGWEALAVRIESRQPMDTSTLPAPYHRYDHSTLRRIWIDGRPADEELVVCHGQPDLALMGFGDGRVTELGVGHEMAPMVADRHLDLAVIHQSIIRHYGAEAVFPFYDSYGRAPDLVLLDHYILATLLW